MDRRQRLLADIATIQAHLDDEERRKDYAALGEKKTYEKWRARAVDSMRYKLAELRRLSDASRSETGASEGVEP